MRRSALLSLLSLVVVTVLAGSARPAGSVQPSWVARVLGTLPGRTRSTAVVLNDRGQVAGNVGSQWTLF